RGDPACSPPFFTKALPQRERRFARRSQTCMHRAQRGSHLERTLSMKKLHLQLLAAGLCASMGFAAVAQAQTAPVAAPQAQQVQKAERGDPARAEQRRARMEQRRAERLNQL